ncbi:vWA domain-containing protein [Lihuaxuella thermophila]|uniref:von Willebrand factor type A domain-containing protein n=1 Tax=Lihuaxuella thermophila TaxID=1173111 RepID=A0A1H8A9F2_9BACL|nr:VWA domain-containing protein [Lihuaxuella thermophila]SEM67221.1 von Willebrand factor type A domain-containing protein [Lihuaxuella thermophila]
MRRKPNFPLLVCSVCICFLMSGCATVMEQIQQTTGSRIEKVDELVTDEPEREPAEEIKIDKEEDIPKSPAPYVELEQILNDDGKGKYAGEEYDKSAVIEALDQMPKGLSEDKAYAYLLGLVGENYKKEVERYHEMEQPDYGQKLLAWEGRKSGSNVGKSPIIGALAGSPVQPQPPAKKANIVVLLDASSSMNGEMDGKSKLFRAEEAILQFASKLPKDTAVFTLRVYGHRGSNKDEDKEISCSSTDKLYSASQVDTGKLNSSLQEIRPTGWTPFAHALSTSYQDMQKGAPGQVENIVLVISDGKDTCGGDPVQAARSLNRSDARSIIHVIGLAPDEEAEKQLRQTADITGGDYHHVSNHAELMGSLQTYLKWIQRTHEPWQFRAVESIAKSYHYDHKRLEQHYQQLVQKTDQEYQRLDQANDYIKEKGKIDGEAWIQIGNWIDHRWKQVGNYADQRWKEIGTRLDEEWEDRYSEIQEAWQEEGGKPEELEKRKQEVLGSKESQATRQDMKKRLERLRVEVHLK